MKIKTVTITGADCNTKTGVRTDDKLDLYKVIKFLEIAKKHTI